MTRILWNWELEKWPHFSYDAGALQELEHRFIQGTGLVLGAFKHVNDEERSQLLVTIMSDEAMNTSEIEGEYLNRDSIQASIRKNLGLEVDNRKIPPQEYGISEMMVDLYRHYGQPLAHDQLYEWHKMVTNGRRDLQDIGAYRSHDDAMQIISGRMDRPKVHYEAPPSDQIQHEMSRFIDWFGQAHDKDQKTYLPLARAGIAHLYFVSIHPFEDGNGRIGRAIAEKSLAQSMKHPALLSLSQTIQQHKREYYAALEAHNTTCNITNWLLYFGKAVLEAQQHTLHLVEFLIEKAKFFDRFASQLNDRQHKTVKRLFDAGHQGFEGGLSAENYTSITQASPSTVTRDLQDMVEKSVLLRTGERKGTRYWLNIKQNKHKGQPASDTVG